MEGAFFDSLFDGILKAANDVFKIDDRGQIIFDGLPRHEVPHHLLRVDRQIAADETEGRDNLRGFLGG